jgi:DNA-binding YbaB/EbfC family protein
MFQGLSNLAGLMKQAQEMGSKLQGLQAQLRERQVTGSAGGGLVEIDVNGAMEVQRCRIDPQLLISPDRELLEDLITSAVNQGVERARQMHADAMQEVTGNLPIPGLQDALAKFTGGGGA